MRQEKLPPEFAELYNKVKYVIRRGKYEYSSTCPYKCPPDRGGTIHDDGSYPDRFRMFLNANGAHKVIGWCRKCHRVWIPSGSVVGDINEEQEWEDENKNDDLEYLEKMNELRLWEDYYKNVDDIRHYYHLRGIPDEFIDYWLLGYREDILIRGDNGWTEVCGASIPLFVPVTREVKNIKYRLLTELNGFGKYRYEVSGVGAPLFYTDTASYPEGHVVAVEGEFKAMRVYIETKGKYSVVGLPGCSVGDDLLKFENCDRVTLILDPDVEQKRLKHIVETIGKERARIVDLPGKVDDMLTEGSLNARDLEYFINNARVWI